MVGVGVAFLGAAKVLSAFFVFNISPSMPQGVYRIYEVPAKLEIGNIVLFDVPRNVKNMAKARGWIPKNLKYHLMKYIMAMEGDQITICKDGLFINGAPAGKVNRFDSQGKPLPVTFGKYQVKPGELFVTSPYESSFDSRYFGPVKISSIIAVAKPVLTTGATEKEVF